jgi:N-acetylmuramoyl-L-alanine amidase
MKITVTSSLPFLLSMMMIKSSPVYPAGIEKYFPDAGMEKLEIKVQPKNISSVQGYTIEEFPEKEKNRNHWDSREGAQIQYLVQHYTVSSFPETLDIFTANIPNNRVSAHYVLTQQDKCRSISGGIPIQVVPEDKRAWHAGISSWGGVKNLNATSIGIENVNSGFIGDEAVQPKCWFPFDPVQITTLGLLSADIVRRYKIVPQNVVGHADIAPTRKQDPGILFPWERLHEDYGVGAWLTKEERIPSIISTKYLPKEPLPQGISEAFFIKSIRDYGYDCPENSHITPEHEGVVKAFKSHFSHNGHPEAYNSSLDESAMLWSWGLVAKYRNDRN